MGGKASKDEAAAEAGAESAPEAAPANVEPRTLPLSDKEKLFTDALNEAMASVKDAEQAAKAAWRARAISLRMQKRVLEICPDPPPPEGPLPEEHHHHHHHHRRHKPKPKKMEEFLGVPVDGKPIPVEICKEIKAMWGRDGDVDKETLWALEHLQQVEREMKLSANAAMQALLDPLIAAPPPPDEATTAGADAAQTDAAAAEASKAATGTKDGTEEAAENVVTTFPPPDLETKQCHLHCATTHVPGEKIQFPEWMPPVAPPELRSPAILLGQHFL